MFNKSFQKQKVLDRFNNRTNNSSTLIDGRNYSADKPDVLDLTSIAYLSPQQK